MEHRKRTDSFSSAQAGVCKDTLSDWVPMVEVGSSFVAIRTVRETEQPTVTCSHPTTAICPSDSMPDDQLGGGNLVLEMFVSVEADLHGMETCAFSVIEFARGALQARGRCPIYNGRIEFAIRGPSLEQSLELSVFGQRHTILTARARAWSRVIIGSHIYHRRTYHT